MTFSTKWLLEQYKKMSGEEKIRIGMELSESVREVWRDGERDRKKMYGKRSKKTSRDYRFISLKNQE